jgi:hypothetical protein
MLKWPTYNQEKKEKAYSEFCSHEFNTFIKLKDPEYFESTVRPFLRNKIEKTVVDFWLLDNVGDGLSNFLEPHSNILIFNFLFRAFPSEPFRALSDGSPSCSDSKRSFESSEPSNIPYREVSRA